jgi:hypothetical protein
VAEVGVPEIKWSETEGERRVVGENGTACNQYKHGEQWEELLGSQLFLSLFGYMSPVVTCNRLDAGNLLAHLLTLLFAPVHFPLLPPQREPGYHERGSVSTLLYKSFQVSANS